MQVQQKKKCAKSSLKISGVESRIPLAAKTVFNLQVRWQNGGGVGGYDTTYVEY